MDAPEWDALLDPEDPPFLEHRFLASLEAGGALGEKAGWIPRIPLLRRGRRLVAAVPLYVKLNSEGEFVFDWSWADFAHRAGIAYYPKLLAGIPFTPVTGRRLLTAAGEDRPALLRMLGQLLLELAETIEASSVHVNFTVPDEIEALTEVGYHHRLGIQYHWFRHGEETFDDYLARFSSKRRNQLRRERRALAEQNVTIEVLTGDALTKPVMETAFRLYLSTVDKFYWGRRYLNRKVFEIWRKELAGRLELVAAQRGSEIVAGAVNFTNGRRLYGRYWGCFEDLRHLHFNVCYYAGVNEALTRKLDVFEPGAGGEHKLVRGFEPTLMHSAHWLRHPALHEAIGRHLVVERMQVERHRAEMLESMGIRRSG